MKHKNMTPDKTNKLLFSNMPQDREVMSVLYTANIFNVIFTVFKCVPISTVISLYGLNLIPAPSTVE